MDIRKARFSLSRRFGAVLRPQALLSLEQGLENVLNTTLPPHCLITGLPIAGADMDLWQHLTFLDAPCCDKCGYPFEFATEVQILCGSCLAHPPKYDKGRSAIAYDDNSRKIVLDFKHGGRTDGLDFFGAQLMRAGRDMLEHADLLIPVPLHKARLRKRKFNQSAVLARKLSHLSGVLYDCDILLRRKNTVSQGGQTFAGRKKNVTGAFHIPTTYKERVKGKNIILIDDVLTSGATLEACTQVLKRAGAVQVNILTLMRVVRPVSMLT